MSKSDTKYSAYEASRIAVNFASILHGHCHHIGVAGSLRRNKKLVNDIDLVCSPVLEEVKAADLFGSGASTRVWPILDQLRTSTTPIGLRFPPSNTDPAHWDALRSEFENKKDPTWANGSIRIRMHHPDKPCDRIKIDLYVCEPSRFQMALLIRTGSADHNRRLAMRAKKIGRQLKANCSGVLLDRNDPDSLVAVTSEEHLFELVKMKYVRPEART